MQEHHCIHESRTVWLELQGLEKHPVTGMTSDLVALSLNLCSHCAVDLIDDFTRMTAQLRGGKRLLVYGTVETMAVHRASEVQDVREDHARSSEEQRARTRAKKKQDVADQLAGKGWSKEGRKI